MNKNLKVKCPHCDTIFPYYESEFRPFCTERCKMIDLGHWFEESYRVPLKDKFKNDQFKKQDEKNSGKNDEEEIFDEDNYDDSYQVEESDEDFE
jgi:endogenous inhibitor of DNA gyrase (YacG/DUF329 family)